MNKKIYIGVLGGSFDPPHEGHLNISKAAISKMKLNEIWWIVTSNNPFKFNSSTYSERLFKTKNFVNGKKIKIVNLKKEQSAFTIDTVLFLKKKYPAYKFIWLMGSDNLKNLKQWKKWKCIFYNIPIAIFYRPLYSFILTKFKALTYFRKAKVRNKLIKKFKYLKPPIWIFIKGLPTFQSSTQLRTRIVDE